VLKRVVLALCVAVLALAGLGYVGSSGVDGCCKSARGSSRESGDVVGSRVHRERSIPSLLGKYFDARKRFGLGE
jgi:hypothetical protein